MSAVSAVASPLPRRGHCWTSPASPRPRPALVPGPLPSAAEAPNALLVPTIEPGLLRFGLSASVCEVDEGPLGLRRRGMVALSVRVHAASDTTVVLVMLVMPYLFCSQRLGGRTLWSGSVDKPVMGAFCASSYEVTPPGRLRATTSSAGPTDRPKDSSTRQAYEESDPAEDVSHILAGLRTLPRSR
jgi:hypothetical protein